MSITMRRIPLYALSAWLALCCAARAEKVTVRGPRPVADAILKLEKRYGWPITYEDPPWVYKGDVLVRKDGKRAGEGLPRTVHPRGGTFTFVMEDAAQTWAVEDAARRWPGRRASEAVARAAILAMLKSYSRSIGGVEIFALRESEGMFHVVPVRRKNASGKLEEIAPVLDTPVSIPGSPSNLAALVRGICRSLAESPGARVIVPLGLWSSPIYTAANPGESARSVLSRVFAEPRATGMSWALLYEPSAGYTLNLHRIAR